MLKKTLTLVIAILFLFTFAVFAQNVGNVNQTGSGNNAAITQTGHNMAVINQNSDNNNATITQSGTNYMAPPIPPSGSGWKYGAYIDQSGGSGNGAVIFMPTSSNGARIEQVGAANAASQIIGATIHKTTDWNHMGLHIKQTGIQNTANQTTIGSYGCYGIQGMIANQFGNYNTANQTSKGGMGSVMEIKQQGDHNNSFQNSDGMYDRTHVDILGNSNTTTQDQSSHVRWSNTNRFADIDINGDFNTVSQTQTAPYQYGGPSLNDLATVNIGGNNNTATQFQDGLSNIADIDINGSNNSASQSQTGNSNDAIILQNGNSNIASATQVGNSNYCSQTQSGGCSSTVVQTGNLNTVTVIQ